MIFFFSDPPTPKRRRLLRLGEIEDASEAVPEVEEPQRAATPPAEEQRVELEDEETVPSPARAATPPMEREEAVEETATESAGASSRPDEAEVPEATAEPPPEDENSTRGAD